MRAYADVCPRTYTHIYAHNGTPAMVGYRLRIGRVIAVKYAPAYICTPARVDDSYNPDLKAFFYSNPYNIPAGERKRATGPEICPVCRVSPQVCKQPARRPVWSGPDQPTPSQIAGKLNQVLTAVPDTLKDC